MSEVKNMQYNKEEKELIDSVESNLDKIKFEKISAIERSRLSSIAKNTSYKNKSITIRISEKDLIKAKAKADHLGMPYQTWISSLIHQNM